MKDPIQEIQDKLEAAWALNEKDKCGQPDALICIKNLLNLVMEYEDWIKWVSSPMENNYLDNPTEKIKQKIFGAT